MDNLKSNLNKALDTAKGTINETVRKAEEFLESDQVKSKVNEVKDLVEDKAEGIAARADGLKDTLEDKLENIADRAEEWKDAAEAKAERIVDRIEDKAEQYKDKVEGLFRKDK
ncbi:mannosyltransferase [Desulfitobacterium sp. THU1]|uniref:mannosyltransferase n=1 Tax=Desulfitobacterium sp. THU1 TaxID=3138072 RepID=UPI00311E92D0